MPIAHSPLPIAHSPLPHSTTRVVRSSRHRLDVLSTRSTSNGISGRWVLLLTSRRVLLSTSLLLTSNLAHRWDLLLTSLLLTSLLLTSDSRHLQSGSSFIEGWICLKAPLLVCRRPAGLRRPQKKHVSGQTEGCLYLKAPLLVCRRPAGLRRPQKNMIFK